MRWGSFAGEHLNLAKVYALMMYSNRLKMGLTALDDIRRRLLDTLLAETLASASRKLMAAE